MAFLKASTSYEPGRAKTAPIQPTIYDAPPSANCGSRTKSFVSEDGHCLTPAALGGSTRTSIAKRRDSSSWGGEGAAGQMDIFLTAKLFWTIPPNTPLDEETSHRVLRNISLRYNGLDTRWDSSPSTSKPDRGVRRGDVLESTCVNQFPPAFTKMVCRLIFREDLVSRHSLSGHYSRPVTTAAPAPSSGTTCGASGSQR